MNSSDLSGFSPWSQWSEATVRGAATTPGVYVFRMTGAQPLRRLKGESDIVYIGSTQKGRSTIQRRLGQHLIAREERVDIGYRMDRVLKEVGALELAWLTCASHDDAQWCEGELLAQYENDHIELPPVNRQESGKRVQHALKRLLSLPSDQAQEVLRSLRAQSKQ